MKKSKLIKLGVTLAPIVWPKIKSYMNKKKMRKNYQYAHSQKSAKTSILDKMFKG